MVTDLDKELVDELERLAQSIELAAREAAWDAAGDDPLSAQEHLRRDTRRGAALDAVRTAARLMAGMKAV